MLEEHGDAIEADLLRFYRVDLLDFHRGTLSFRRLGVLVKQLPPSSALVRAQNGGVSPWTPGDHIVADLWALWANQDHPTRAKREAAAKAEKSRAKLHRMRAKLRNVFQPAESDDEGGSS